MNELTVFDNPDFGQIRTLTINNEPWFVGKDVADALGYAEPSKAVRTHVDDPDRGVSKMDTPQGTKQDMVIINESGLYALIFASKLPKAKEFKRWVTNEVLPSIRKTGGYSINKSIDKAEIQLQKLENAKSRERRLTAKSWLDMAKLTDNQEYRNIMLVYAANTIAGTEVLPLPEVTEITYTATEVGEMFGLTKHKIGSIANKHGLKVAENGKWVLDKASHCNKPVTTFRYNEKGINAIREILKADNPNLVFLD